MHKQKHRLTRRIYCFFHQCQCFSTLFQNARAVDNVAQTCKSAVSQVSKPANRPNLRPRPYLSRPADLSVSVSLRRDRAEAKGEGGEVGDTAGLETCATSLSIPPSQNAIAPAKSLGKAGCRACCILR